MLIQVLIIILALAAGLATIFYAPIKKTERFFVPAVLAIVALLTINTLGPYPYATETTVAIVFFITAFPCFSLIKSQPNKTKPKWLRTVDVMLFGTLIATTISYLALTFLVFSVPHEKTPYITKNYWSDKDGDYEHRTYEEGLEFVVSMNEITPEESPWELYFRRGINTPITQYIKTAAERSVEFSCDYNKRTVLLLDQDMLKDVEEAIKGRKAKQGALTRGGVASNNSDAFWIKTDPTDAFVMKINNTPTYKYTEGLFAYNVRHVLRKLKARGFEVDPLKPTLHVVTLATPRPTEQYTHENAWKHLIDVEIIVPVIAPKQEAQ